MTLIEAIRGYFQTNAGSPVHVQDLYAHMPDRLEHSIRARIYENLGKHFTRVGKGLYVAYDASSKATCVVACRDAWQAVQELPSSFVDCLLTDPPYPWLDTHIGHGTSRPRMQWKFERKDVDRELGLELYRVLKEGAHAWFFIPSETATTRPHIEGFIHMLEGCGFVFNKRFIWDKLVMGMGYNGRARHEGILFMSKGQKRKPCDLGTPDVLAFRAIPPSRRRHQCQKPQALLEALIRFSTMPGELVMDCFAGACGVGHAALKLARNALLVEKSAKILDVALEPIA